MAAHVAGCTHNKFGVASAGPVRNPAIAPATSSQWSTGVAAPPVALRVRMPAVVVAAGSTTPGTPGPAPRRAETIDSAHPRLPGEQHLIADTACRVKA